MEPNQPAAEALTRDALTDRVYEELLSRIIDMRFPPGGRLKIDQLARELSVSHTPIREALNRLASERLVELQPYRGFRVTPLLDEAGLRQLLDAREVIETGAVRRAAARISEPELDALATLITGMDSAAAGDSLAVRRFNELDARFHQVVVAASGNAFLVAAFDGLRAHIQIARHFTRRSLDEAHNANAEHRRVLQALRDHDRTTAAKATRAHLSGVLARLREAHPPIGG